MKDKPIGSYHGLARAQAEEELGGRFAQLPRPHVAGSEPTVKYPEQPHGSPWRGDNLPNEEPLGYRIDDQLPTGELFEQERSLRSSSPTPTAAQQSVGEAPSSVSQPPTGVGDGGAPFKRRI